MRENPIVNPKNDVEKLHGKEDPHSGELIVRDPSSGDDAVIVADHDSWLTPYDAEFDPGEFSGEELDKMWSG